jgi:hypothetical protein
MNPTAASRKTRADVRPEKAEQPQDKQDYDDSPQHEISPFERLTIGCKRWNRFSLHEA